MSSQLLYVCFTAGNAPKLLRSRVSLILCGLLVLASCEGASADISGAIAPALARQVPKQDAHAIAFPGQPAILLTRSKPVIATAPGEVIENLWIEASGADAAISISGIDDVIVRNVVIFHAGGPGISVANAANVRIENVRVVNLGAPVRGPLVGEGAERQVNITAYNAASLRVRKAYLEKGAAGILVENSRNVTLSEIQGFDFRGPFPRGQLIQFVWCIDPTLDTFSVINPGDTAWTEDAINSFNSTDPVIRNGYIEGINSPSGIGVLIENPNGGSGGLVENVDVRYWVNGAFSAAANAKDVVFKNVRAYDGISTAENVPAALAIGMDGRPVPTLQQWEGDNFRGEPLSGQEPFMAYGASAPASIEYRKAAYRNLARADRVAWDRTLMRVADFHVATGAPRRPYVLTGP